MHESVIVIILVALCFIFHDQLGVQSCTVAIAAACIMLLIGGQEPEEIIADVEWPTILFFYWIIYCCRWDEKSRCHHNACKWIDFYHSW